MNEPVNPYNCSLPGNFFVGYENTIPDLFNGFRNGKSYAVLGGRKSGKTSLLMKIEKRLGEPSGVPGFRAFPCMLDLSANVPHSGFDFFRAIHDEVVRGTTAQPWREPPASGAYQEFLSRIEAAGQVLSAKGGADWLAVLLIDKLDLAAKNLPDDEVFQNLRNLLTTSRQRRHFRLVATGGSDMSQLVRGGSPLNNLDPIYLRPLAEPEATELTAPAIPTHGEVRAQLFELSGRHPYILQGLLEYLWDDRERLGEESVRLACRRFLKDRMNTFERWVQVMGQPALSVYRTLGNDPTGAVDYKALKSRARVSAIDDAVRILSFHGIVDDADPDVLKINGTLFRDWFNRNDPGAGEASKPAALPAESGAEVPRRATKNVFVVHGRNRKALAATYEFLHALGLNPLEWTAIVEATRKPAPYIGEILDKGFEIAQAAVVLLTGDDDAKLREEFLTSNDLQSEGILTPQPRPNVLFEAGMSMALFRDRTVLVRLGPVRPFTDISGIHVLEMDNSVPKRRHFAKRLQAAGCELLDLAENVEWQTAGDFSLKTAPPR